MLHYISLNNTLSTPLSAKKLFVSLKLISYNIAMITSMPKDYRAIRIVLIVVLALNWLVAIAKIICGLVIRSSSMTADGFHSLSDGASNIIGLIGINFASRP